MKRLVIGAMLVATPMLSLAKDYGAAGCGVGAMIFEGQSGLGPHVLAATTNGFYGTQTFAMSSGTLGCDVSGTIQSHTAMYIDSNMENIASDIARGEGEALMALAASMGIADEDKTAFSATLQNNFAVIYPNEDVTSASVMDAIVAVLKSSKDLAKYAS